MSAFRVVLNNLYFSPHFLSVTTLSGFTHIWYYLYCLLAVLSTELMSMSSIGPITQTDVNIMCL
jgi:hypothetical protein